MSPLGIFDLSDFSRAISYLAQVDVLSGAGVFLPPLTPQSPWEWMPGDVEDPDPEPNPRLLDHCLYFAKQLAYRFGLSIRQVFSIPVSQSELEIVCFAFRRGLLNLPLDQV